MQIGIQMYSLRNYIPKAGLEKTLGKIKETGFDCIEPICFDYGMGYENVSKLMRKLGLSAPCMHVPYEIIADKAELSKLKDIFDIKTAVIPYISAEDLQNTAKTTDMLSVATENARSLGIKPAYHNHAHEFKNGGSPVRLCSLCPDLKLQTDVFWVKAAGLTPAEFLKNNASYVCSIHMKEFGTSADAAQPIVGSGTTDAKAVLTFAKEHDLDVTLEYEHTDIDEIEYIIKSLQFIKDNLK